MLPSVHFLSSSILTLILFPFFSWYSLIVYLGGFFIDFDHYLIFVIKKKDFSLKNAYNYFRYDKKHDWNTEPLIFHFLELTFILIILSFFHWIFFLLVSGIILHLTLDFIHEVKHNKFTKHWFFFYWYYNR